MEEVMNEWDKIFEKKEDLSDWEKPAGSVSKLLNSEAQINFLKDRFKPHFIEMKMKAEAIEVTNDDSELQAVEMVKQVKDLVKSIEKQRKAITDTPRLFVKAIGDFCNTFKKPLESIEGKTRNKLSNYQGQKEFERRKREKADQDKIDEMNKRLQAEAKKEGIESKDLPAVVLPVEKKEVVRTESGASSHVRMDWKFIEVVDFSKVPEEFKILDEKLVNSRIKAGIHVIPGLKIEEVATTVVR